MAFLALAPMDGFTDSACRLITQEIFDQRGDRDQVQLGLWTEFMPADGYFHNPAAILRHLFKYPQERNCIAQIFGGNPERLQQCFRELQQYCQPQEANGFIGLELNMGCPAHNIMRSGGGAELIKDKQRSLQILKDLHDQLEVPLSLKTRAGVTQEDKQAQLEFLLNASDIIETISLHGRTVTQGYAGEADWERIRSVKKALVQAGKSHVRVIGNGGITSYEQALAFHEGVDGVMIGQAGIGNPWIFTPHVPSSDEIFSTIVRHLDLMIQAQIWMENVILVQDPHIKKRPLLLGETGIASKDARPEMLRLLIPQFRKHLFSYFKGLPGSKEQKILLTQVTEYQELIDILHRYFRSL